MSNDQTDNTSSAAQPAAKPRRLFAPLLVLTIALVTFGVTALLVTIFEHKQEARVPFVRVAEVDEATIDPSIWGRNWPHQFDSYRRAVDTTETEFGGSSAMPESKLESDPWLKRLYAGYAFSIDYREARGHAFMLHDQEVTERVTQRQQGGACLHCHASVIPTYRRLGLEAKGQTADAAALAGDFNWPAVMAGFEATSTMTYEEAHAELNKTPQTAPEGHPEIDAHPVTCVDCHNPDSMQIRVTRPGFMRGIAALAAGDAPVPHLPSITRWREGKRKRDYDPNIDASRQEMRSFVCGQCHVEYYCASKETLFFPWKNGLRAEQIEATYDDHKFPDGTPFFDWKHGETGANVYKAQHPEFELWSQGIHARSGVSCADCHMPFERKGAMKVSSHSIRSPLLSINRSCQTCHNVPEEELHARVTTIQQRTRSLLERAAAAMTDMLDAIRAAEAAGIPEEQLQQLHRLQRRGMWRLDFISSENSKGCHADQEAARILGEAIDYCRQAEALANRLRAPETPASKRPVQPILGVTPQEKIMPNRGSQ